MAGSIRLVYNGNRFDIPDLKMENYRGEFFQMELDLESDVFYELRVSNGWLPHRIKDSSPRELMEISDFFNQYRDSFYFLFDNGRLAGSTLHKRNYIQSLCVAREFQGKGYGTLLTKYAVNRILASGFACVELDVFPDNTKAISMYKKIGFMQI